MAKRIYLFDSDGTLYDDRMAKEQFEVLVRSFVHRRLGVAPDAFKGLMDRLRQKHSLDHSTSLCLSREFGIPLPEIYAETYQKIDLSLCGVAMDQALSERLSALPGERYVWTNAPRDYAQRVVRELGLRAVFRACFCMEDVEPYVKPQPEAYQALLRQLPEQEEVTLIDDRLDNLQTAKAFGWRTVYMNRITETPSESFIDRCITRLIDI